jgi:hypothetical protein
MIGVRETNFTFPAIAGFPCSVVALVGCLSVMFRGTCFLLTLIKSGLPKLSFLNLRFLS